MTSQLSRQLISLSAPETDILDHRKKRASILFSASEAANFSRETYYQIGVSGFSELLEINDHFKKFEKDLFGVTSKDFQRYIQTKESNYVLDEKINEFLLIISPYLQKQASLKALEWLIYRFYINEKNIESLMMCILPYYETVLFVRILQTVDIRNKNSPWNWLHKSQIQGRPISKDTVFLHWSSCQAFRNFLSKYFLKMVKVSKCDEHVEIAISLLISTQIGGLASAGKINENHMSSICQTLQKCLSLENSHALYGTLLMISQLSISVQLSQDLLHEIIYKIAQISDPSFIGKSVLCLLTLFYHQNIKSIPHPTLKLFEANDKLFREISKLSFKKPVGSFVSTFVKEYIRMTLRNEILSEDEKKAEVHGIVEKIISMPFPPVESSKIIRSFLRTLSECESELREFKEDHINIAYLLKMLEMNHPDGFDMTCAHIMKRKKTDKLTFEQKLIRKFQKNYEIKVLPIKADKKKEDKSTEEEQWLSCLKSGNLSSPCIEFLEKMCSLIILSDERKKNKFWYISGEDEFDESLKLLVKLLKVIVAHQMQNTNSTVCNGLLKSIFNEKLGSVRNKIYFLSMILGWNMENEDVGVDRSLKLWALNFTSAILDSERSSCSLSWVLDAKEPLVTSLLIPICEGSFLCEASYKVLQNMHSIVGGRLKSNNLSMLIEEILSKKEEINADISYLPLAVEMLVNKNKGEGAHMIDVLFTCVTDNGVPLHIRSAVLYSLSKINSKKILMQLIPIGNSYLDEIETLKGTLFDVTKSTFLYYILIRFVSENSAFLEIKGGWELFLRSLQMPDSVLQIQDKILSPQQLVINYKVLQKLSNSEKLLDVLEILLTRIVRTNLSVEASKLSKELKKISLSASQIISLWNKYNIIPKYKSVQEARAKRLKRQRESIPQSNIEDLQKLGLIIELIGVMEDLKNPSMLIGPICEYLKILMEMESSFADTLQQQMLSVCHHLMTLCKTQLDKKEFIKQCKLNVALIVQCIRSSVNPDIHRRALLILALAAEYFPDQVLHNIMAIFTFMGTSLLRRDDAYSFHVIHLTIESIVPALIKAENAEPKVLLKKLSQVTQVFVDALPDLAEHRRLPLFTQLATTLGVSQYLWLVMVLISDAYVSRNVMAEELSSQEKEPRRLPHNIYFALVLYSQFPVIDQLKASCEVVDFVINLPHSKDSLKGLDLKNVKELHSSTLVINVEMRNSIQLRRIKYTCLGLIVNLLTSERFIGQVYEVIDSNSEEELNKIKELYQRLLEETLEYLKFVCHQMKSQKESQNERYWAAMERKLADLVDAVNSILPPELLVDVVSKLLNTKSDMIRCRAMEILAAKLQPDIKFFKDEFVDNLLGFIDPLLKIAVNNKEQEESRQIALFTLQLLVRRMYLVDDLTVFSPILASSTSLLKEKDLSVKVLTQATLVIAELIHAMKKFSLIYLNEVFPSLLSILENSLKDELQNLDNLQIAAATALLRVVENVPRLLPRNYMETLLIIICQLMSKEENEDGQKESKLANKLSSILDLLLQNVESRILLPCLSKTFDVLCLKDVFSLPSLMKFIEVMIGFLKPSEITLYKKHLNQLFTNALDVRTSKLSLDEKTLNHVESCVISAVIRFLLKLNGEDNVAFIKMLMEWAWSNIQQKPSRLTTFFRFSSRLANGLKVLFIKTNIAILIHPKAAEILDQNNNLLTNKTVFGKGTEAESKASELIRYVLETLSNIYLYDTVSFTNEDRFTEIVKSLTNQIENTIGTEENHKARISDHLKTCIIRLTKALTDDSLWKELNSQILSRIRTDNDSKVILSGLEIFEGIVEALGEDYLQPLLADTIPSIIEVLESLDVDVEMKTKEIFYKMEAILGDSLRAYLET